MNVTRDVVKDLLPLYVAGEASGDTRALVEEFLRNDPELARLAETLRAEDLAPVEAPPGTELPRAMELAALERTRGALRSRSRLLGLALLFTGLPLSFVFDGSGLRFLLIRDQPALASAFLVAACSLWIAYVMTVRRTRVTGL